MSGEEESKLFKEPNSGLALQEPPKSEAYADLKTSSEFQYISLPDIYRSIDEHLQEKDDGVYHSRITSVEQLKAKLAKKYTIIVLTGTSRVKESKNKNDYVRAYFSDLQKYPANKEPPKCRRLRNDLLEGYLQIQMFVFRPALTKLVRNLVFGSVWVLKGIPLMKIEKKELRERLMLTVEEPESLEYIGLAKDFGHCAGESKSEKKCHNFVHLKVQKICDLHKRIEHFNLIENSNRVELKGGLATFDPSRSFGVTTVGELQRKLTVSQVDEFFGSGSEVKFLENYRRMKQRNAPPGPRVEKKEKTETMTEREARNKENSNLYLQQRAKKLNPEADIVAKLEEKRRVEAQELKDLQAEKAAAAKREEKRAKEFSMVVELGGAGGCGGSVSRVDIAGILEKKKGAGGGGGGV